MDRQRKHIFSNTSWRDRIVLVLQLTGTIVLLTILFRRVEWQSITALLGTLPTWFFFVSADLMLVAQIIFAAKWYVVARSLKIDAPFWFFAEQYFVALFFNNFLPTAMGGDAAKIYYVGKRTGYVNAGASVLLDRLLGFALTTFFALVLIFALGLNSPAFVVARNVLIGVLVTFSLIVVAFCLPMGGWLEKLGQRLPPVGQRVIAKVKEVVKELGRIREAPLLVPAVAVGVVGYYGILSVIYVLFFRLIGLDGISYGQIAAVILSIAILTNIPITVNGIGLREQLHFLLFGGLAVAKEVAVSASLLIFALLLVMSLIGSILFVIHFLSRKKLETSS